MCLNTWFPVGENVLEALAGVASLEEVCLVGQALRFQEPMPFPVSTLCFDFEDLGMTFLLLIECHACLPATKFSAMMVIESDPLKLLNAFSDKLS